MRQSESHEIRLLLTNGRVVHFTLHEMRRLIYGRNVIVLLVVFLFIIAGSNPTLFPSLPQFRSRVFYWGVSIVLYLVLLPFWALLLRDVWCRYLKVPVPLIIATAPLVIALTAWSNSLGATFGDLVPPRGNYVAWTTYLKNCLLAHCLETAALLWFLPLNRDREVEETAPETEAPAAPEARDMIVLGGRSVPVKDIRSVSSAEHCVIVATGNRSFELRARMKDFLEQVTDEQGIQTHRSHWVAADEVEELRGGAVKTRSGTEFPVSRGRMPAVREWFAQQGKIH